MLFNLEYFDDRNYYKTIRLNMKNKLQWQQKSDKMTKSHARSIIISYS